MDKKWQRRIAGAAALAGIGVASVDRTPEVPADTVEHVDDSDTHRTQDGGTARTRREVYQAPEPEPISDLRDWDLDVDALLDLNFRVPQVEGLNSGEMQIANELKEAIAQWKTTDTEAAAYYNDLASNLVFEADGEFIHVYDARYKDGEDGFEVTFEIEEAMLGIGQNVPTPAIRMNGDYQRDLLVYGTYEDEKASFKSTELSAALSATIANTVWNYAAMQAEADKGRDMSEASYR